MWLVVVLPRTSTSISSQPRLVPRPWPLVVPLLVSVFDIICNSPLPCVPPLLFSWLLHIPVHQPLALCPSCPVGCCIFQHLSLSLSSRITVSVVVTERVRRQCRASFAVAIFACVHCKRGVSPAVALATRACCQGPTLRREQVRVDDVRVPGTPLELGQKASCVKPVVTRLTQN